MALLDDLVAQVRDDSLRHRMEDSLADLKRRQRFGLVFEEHVPETTALFGLPVQVGAMVQRRDDGGGALYRVVSVNRHGKARLEPADGTSELVDARVRDLLVIKQFGEPIYPALTSVGAIRRGPTSKPHHAVINGENFHALQLLLYLYEGQVDCIYIDPPYNTGATDWKYNNRYVDASDAWRHSKWLSMIDKRLRLARRLLKPDGVLIVTVDHNEVHHLGMLLERLLPDARRQMVSICINPSGANEGGGLSRVEEYAFFCFLGGAQPSETDDDMLVDELADGTETETHGIRWERLMRGGNAWYRDSRRGLCYPIVLSKDRTKIVRAGDPLAGEDESARSNTIDGHPVIWPVRQDGRLGIWRVEPRRLDWLAQRGYAFVSERKNSLTAKYLLEGTVDLIEHGHIKVIGRGERGEVLVQGGELSKVAKTVWYRGRHTAGGSGGTYILNALLGERNVFPFPKSVYAVRDCLRVAIGGRPNALVVDFFAGSGTTLHAASLMNMDGGSRRCVLVTNNEVDDSTARSLASAGHYRGDPRFEEKGIFERVTRPRCTSAITGRRPDGKPTEGHYLDGRAYSDGFEENVEFFRLDYLDPDQVDLRRQFDAILPALWLAAGGVGEREHGASARHFSMPNGCTYAVLFREASFRKFSEALRERPEITHAYLVTDSETAYAEMRAAIPPRIRTSMLYRDYLRNFRINTRTP